MQRRQTVTVPNRHPRPRSATEAAYKGRVTDPSALSNCSNSFLFSARSSKEEDMADARMFTEEDYGYPGRP